MCFSPQAFHGISISYNGGSLLGLLLYSYETNLVQWVLIFTFRYLNDIISLNNSNLDDGVNTIYPIEFEINDTAVTASSVSCINPYLELDSESELRTNRYDKRNDFNFPIVIFS